MGILAEKKERYGQCAELAESLLKAADAEGRDMAAEEQTRFDTLMDEHAKLGEDIGRREKAEAAKAAVTKSERKTEPQKPGNPLVVENRIEFPRTRAGQLKAFKGADAEERAYKSGMWLAHVIYGNTHARDWCLDHGMSFRAQSEGINTAGGYLVPDEMSTSIIDLQEQYGVFRRYANVARMTRDVQSVPRRTGGLTPYFVGEGVEPTETTKGWDQVKLVAKKLMTETKYSTEVAEDAIINMADDLTREIGIAFALKEDQCGINGDATATYGGMTGIRTKMIDGVHTGSYYTALGGAGACDVWSEAGTDDLDGVMGILPAYAMMAEPKWYCPVGAVHSIFGRLLMAGSGNKVSDLAGKLPLQYAGYEIVPVAAWADSSTTDYSATIMVLFGALQLAATIGDRRSVSVKVADQLYAATDQVGIFGSERFDINVHDIGGTAAGPMVGLLGA